MIEYRSYRDLRGDAAKPISVALGIDESSGVAHTGYLVEIREADEHVRISAHSATCVREVLLNNDRRLEDIYIDVIAEQARKTVYDPNGTITVYVAPWSISANGHEDEYKLVERVESQLGRAAAEWEKYDALLTAAEVHGRGE